MHNPTGGGADEAPPPSYRVAHIAHVLNGCFYDPHWPGSVQLQPTVAQTVQQHVLYEIIWIRGTCD